MTAEFEKEIQAIFFQEATVNLEQAEELYLKLNENSPIELIEHCFRIAHNLKGSSKSVGFDNFSTFLHKIESLLLLLKDKKLKPSVSVGNILLECNDKLVVMLKDLKSSGTSNVVYDDLSQKIETLKNTLSRDQGVTLDKSEIITAMVDHEIIFFDKESPKVENNPNNETHEIKAKSENKINKINLQNSQRQKKEIIDEFLRVPMLKIEKLQNYVGEIVILESMLKEEIKSDMSVTLKNYFRQLDKITKEVRDTVMSLRLVPIKPVFQKLSRTARDTGSSLNKNINIQFIGEDTEIDKFILDDISDPLMHMVRNSVDHGLENEEDRKLKNKPPIGQVIVEATHEAGFLILNISDDGKGLNPSLLKEKAEQKGLIEKNSDLTTEECFDLIFAPGFSTKSEVSEISGRGVGMDVVRTNIESLKGTISIQSELDIGTKFRIKIPLSIGIMDAFIVECNKEKYVIPVYQIKEAINLNSSNIQFVTGMGNIIQLRDEEINIYDLGVGLSIKNNNNKNNDERVILITQSKEKKIGLIVDKIISIQSVVTKSLGDELRLESGIIGSVILGNGKAVPILETTSLIKNHNFISNIKGHEKRIIL